MFRIASAIGLVMITIVIWPPLRPAVEELLNMARGQSDFQDLVIDVAPYAIPVVAIIVAVLMIIVPLRSGGTGGIE